MRKSFQKYIIFVVGMTLMIVSLFFISHLYELLNRLIMDFNHNLDLFEEHADHFGLYEESLTFLGINVDIYVLRDIISIIIIGSLCLMISIIIYSNFKEKYKNYTTEITRASILICIGFFILSLYSIIVCFDYIETITDSFNRLMRLMEIFSNIPRIRVEVSFFGIKVYSFAIFRDILIIIMLGALSSIPILSIYWRYAPRPAQNL